MTDHLPPRDTSGRDLVLRRFGEKEVGEILKRASELQRASPARPDPSGFSLAELEEIAVEAGIDPDNLRRAVTEMDARGESKSGEWFLGGPTKIAFEQVVPGELDTNAFGRMIPILHSALASTGQPNVVGKTLTWNATLPNTARTVQLMVMSESGQTLIRIEENTGSLAGGLMGGIGSGSLGIGIPGGIAIGQVTAAALGLLSGVGIVVGSLVLARTIYKAVFKNRRRELADLFHQLVEFVRGAATMPEGIAPSDAETIESGEMRILPAPENPTG